MLTNLYCAYVARMKSEEGATAVEYGILIAFIAILIISGATALSGGINALFAKVVAAINPAAP